MGLLTRLPSIVLIATATMLVACAMPDSPFSAEENWPQWRGPFGTGAAPEAKPPTVWSDTKNVKWKVKVPGEGTATPIVWGNQVFIQTAIPTGKKVAAVATKSDATPVSPRQADAAPPQSQSSSSRLLDRFDVNKDGKISRSEIPEGTLRDVFDRMVTQYKLDPDKTYTRAELEKIMGVSASTENRPSGENPPGPSNPQQRRPGGGGPQGDCTLTHYPNTTFSR